MILARARRLAANVVLATGTSLRHLRDDPVAFALLLGQRFPTAVAKPASMALDRLPWPVSRAWASWMRGDRQQAISRLEQASAVATRHRHMKRQGRAEAALALAADRPDLVAPGSAPPLMTARAAWQRGDLRGALEAVSGKRRPASAYRRVLEGERALLRPGASISRRATRSQTGSSRSGDNTAGGRSLRVLHLLTNSLPHTQSGYTLRSHAILRAQRDIGLDVMAVTRLGYPVTIGRLFARDCDSIDGIPYLRLLAPRLAESPEARLQQQIELLLQQVRDFAPDVVHTTTPYTNALVAQALAAELGVPWTYEVRGMLEKTWAASRATETAQRDAESSERFALVRARETELAMAADHVFTLSTTMRDELVDRGVPGERITLTPNAIDGTLLERDPAALPNGDVAERVSDAARAYRAKLGLAEGGLWVGAVSSLVDYEGHDLLVDAVATLRGRGHDVRLLLVGDGAAKSSLERRIRSLGLSEYAYLPGRIPASRAHDYVRALDVVAIPRRDLEVTRSVTPLKPIEAMAIGRPVVLSDLPPLRELAGGERTSGGKNRAVVVAADDSADLADGVEHFLQQSALPKRLLLEGRAFAAERTWRANAETYAETYRSVVG